MPPPDRGSRVEELARKVDLGLRKTCLLFPDLLDHLVPRTYRTARRIHGILDNYGSHDSFEVRLALATEKGRRLKFQFLPPYCPGHNRIERVREDLHANVTRNHRCLTIERLMEQVSIYLDPLTRHGHHCYGYPGGTAV